MEEKEETDEKQNWVKDPPRKTIQRPLSRIFK